MPGRQITSSDYRYGFNGMENDPEISNGNYTTHFRALDTRIGRWWTVDPEEGHYKLVGYSPYHFAYNCPIVFVDQQGNIPIIPIILFLGKAALVGGTVGGGVAGAFAYANDDNVGQAFQKGFVEGAIVGASLGAGGLVAGAGGITGGLYYGGQASIGFFSGFTASAVGQGMDRDLYGNRNNINGQEAISDGFLTAAVAPASELFINFSVNQFVKRAAAQTVKTTDKEVKRQIIKQYKSELRKIPKRNRPKGKDKRNLRHGYIKGAKEIIKNKNASVEKWKVRLSNSTTVGGTVTFDGLSKQQDGQFGEEISMQREEFSVRKRKVKHESSQNFSMQTTTIPTDDKNNSE